MYLKASEEISDKCKTYFCAVFLDDQNALMNFIDRNQYLGKRSVRILVGHLQGNSVGIGFLE